MTHRRWTMLYRREDGLLVCIYEPLTSKEVKKLTREGWKYA